MFKDEPQVLLNEAHAFPVLEVDVTDVLCKDVCNVTG